MIITAIAAGLAVAWLMQGLWCLLQLQRSSPYQHQPANTSTNSSATASANLATISMLALLGSLTIAVAYSSGTRHDYTAYTNQWEIVLGGGNPWIGTDNAYGPLHNAMAWVYGLNHLLPKGLFALLHVATGAISSFGSLGINDTTSRLQKSCLFAFFVLSPYSLITVGVYANNDILPAAAMVLALMGVVAFNNRISSLASGSLLAIGVLSKFYPLIILPSLAFRQRKLDWALLSGFLATLLLGGSLAYWHWGHSALLPLLFASSRSSKDLSIFHFTSKVLGAQLDSFSLPLMVVAFAAVSWFLHSRNVNAVIGSIVTFAAVLSFYKVGHQQFFLFFFLVSPFAIRYLLSCSTIFTPKLASAFLLWIGFLNWYQLVFQLTCGMWEGPATTLRYWGALPFLALSAGLATTTMRSIAANNGRSRQHKKGWIPSLNCRP
ncbi:hypothetical protein KBY97_10855 [Synechococcus sp. ATX 2A4]|uniref:hypothetical protein n=1 Tax=Synechococcus sp. ATX 2A4 TaxID=2823727 RepID=UPI0020CC6D7A|nr:hypothetical protein [Synechococcus sp. ATX 2A4]MCP9885618.1 hypothetical protein [Synechococcus sp. ATX 2A4]